ncbi:MAG: hypothetical protein NVSMB4_00170 [Acidimicrobiales bacterium]
MTPTAVLADIVRADRDEVVVDPLATYSIAGVRSFGRGLFDRETILGAATSYPKLYRLRTGQIVMSRLFAWEGAVAVVTDEFNEKFVSSEFPTFTIDTTRADPRYVSQFVRWPGLHERLAGAGRGLGQRRQRVHAEDFLGMDIPLPSIEAQRRVAKRLDHVEAACAELRKTAARAGTLNGALVVSAAMRLDLSHDEKRRESWQEVPLGDVLEPSASQVTVEPADAYLIAGIYSFGRGLIDRGSITGADTSYRTLTRLAIGDIVVSKLNGWEGAVAVVESAFDGYHVSSEYPTFSLDRERLLPEFFAGIARAPSFWDALNTSARGSMVRRRRINPKEFLSTRVWLPPIASQARSAQVIAGAAGIGEARSEMAARIDALLPAALNEAFVGLC